MNQQADSIAIARTTMVLLLALQPFCVIAQTVTKPCEENPEYRQFDFWIGEWDVTDEGKVVAHSSIQCIVESCIIFENYAQDDDYSGKSFNFVDCASGKWRQLWIDSRGTVSEFTGKLEDGGISYEGETHFLNGKTVQRKMILSPVGGDRVRQYSERSTDGGKTWSVAYDYLYVRSK